MKSSEVVIDGRHARDRSPVACSLRALASVGVLGAALVSASAFAGTKFIDVQVDPLVPNNASGAPSVSYSGVKAALGQTLNAAYRATLTNATSSNINNAWFKVHTSINDGQGPVFVIVPQGCTVDSQVAPLGSGLVCLVSLPATVPATSAAITFIIPTPNAPTSGQDSTLKLVWTVQAGQGNSDSNPSNVVQHDSPPIILSLDSSAGLRSYVVHGTGFKVTVGNSNTQVTPPKDVPVDLKQDIDSSSCSAMYKKCFKSTLSIVDPLTNTIIRFDDTPLFVDLLRDKSTLKGFADINNLALSYSNGTSTVPINPCNYTGSIPPTTPPTLADYTYPGTDERCYIPASPANPFTFVDGAGHWHIRVLEKTNGIVQW